jgi:hypothetical protein
MIPLQVKLFFVFILIYFGKGQLFSQSENWYLLQIVGQVSESELKGALSFIQQVEPNCSVWFNDSRSNTIGCKSTNTISWPQVISEMRAHGFYLADVTDCRCHHSDVRAISSIYFIEACYYATHSEALPQGWTAKLNRAEYDALPELAKNYYQATGNLELVNK